MELERFEESRAALEAAIDFGPDFAEAYKILGHLYSWKHYRYDKAIQAYRKLYSMDPEVPYYSLNLGWCYYELGITEEAIFFYERYLEGAPTEVFSFIARLNLHALRGEVDLEEPLFEHFKREWTGTKPSGRDPRGTWHRDPWVVIMLGGLDARYGHPELAVERFEMAYPELTVADPEIDDYMLFKAATAYATNLHLCGEKEKAGPLTKKILQRLPEKSRYRWKGIEYMDTWLHMAMGDEVKAMQALREWRDIGGCEDLTRARIFQNSLFENPEFRKLNNEMVDELAEQRANVARMEAAGELAPVPGLPSS